MIMKELCSESGMTQKELARLSGISLEVIQEFENKNLGTMSDDALFRMSLVLGLEYEKEYEPIQKDVREQIFKEVKANFVHELAETEIDDCIRRQG